jgi:oxygen-independent coproporphyrinogen-3 oxidase
MLPRHVYLHVPFCARRCSYCDFAIAVRHDVPVDAYVASVRRELEVRWGGGGPWEADTLYFGGGTPSRLGGAGIARALEAFRDRITLAPGAEVTIEANPEDVTREAARAWRDAGVTRVSLGAQSFDPAVLRWMHRGHAPDAAARAVDILRGAELEDVSLDLIFAVPEVLGRDWDADVRSAIALDPTHLSLYGLTVEPRTPLGRWEARGEVTQAPEERYEEEFLRAHELMAAADFEHYEVSNFARPGRRARHNSAYWRHVPYAGLGPSAHGFDGVARRWNASSYTEWARRLADGEDPAGGSELLSDENRTTETVYLGLRTTDGLRLANGERVLVEPWVQAGWAVATTGGVRLTPAGWLRLDTLAAALTVSRSC